jgi:hypothetical protein
MSLAFTGEGQAGLGLAIVRLRRAVEAIKAAIKAGVTDEITRLSEQPRADAVRAA